MAGNPNALLRDRQLQHQVWMLRRRAGVLIAVQRLLRETRNDVFDQAMARLSADVDRGPYTTRRLVALVDELEGLLLASHARTTSLLEAEMLDLVTREGAFQLSLLERSAPVAVEASWVAVDALQLQAIVNTNPVQGTVLSKWAGKLARSDRNRMLKELRKGNVAGETVEQLGRRVRKALNISRRNALSVARTVTSTFGLEAKQSLYRANKKHLRAQSWDATLDSRTTIPCAVRHRRLYTVAARPRPIRHSYPWCIPGWGCGPGGLHYGCRSVAVPELKRFPSPKPVTFNQWLRRRMRSQSGRDFVRSYLGPGRFRRFADGVPLEGLVNDRGLPILLSDLPPAA